MALGKWLLPSLTCKDDILNIAVKAETVYLGVILYFIYIMYFIRLSTHVYCIPHWFWTQAFDIIWLDGLLSKLKGNLPFYYLIL